MYEVFLIIIVILLLVVKTREHLFGILDALHVGGNDWYNTDAHGEGYEIFNSAPLTCPPDKPDLNVGLCYPACRAGYHGAMTMCVKDTFYVGGPTIVGLEPCPEGWDNDGLTCRKPIRCEPIQCHSVSDCFSRGKCGCTGGGCTGGDIKGRLDHGGVCPGPQGNGWDMTDRIAGMCYPRCPPGQGHLPGAPYACAKDPYGPLTYDRGVGRIPPIFRFFNKYTFP